VANLACVGARAVAVVNCLNFGNPEHPEVMWQLSEAIDGMAHACTALGLPVIGGNVSLYNESGGVDIDPTPVIGTVGLADVLRFRPPGARWGDGDTIVLLGNRRAVRPAAEDVSAETLDSSTMPDVSAETLGGSAVRRYPLGGSRWAVEVLDLRAGPLPRLDLDAHRRVCDLVVDLVAESMVAGHGRLTGVHDVSGGGLAVALGEMTAASGLGCEVRGLDGSAELFCEIPSRIVVATDRPDEVVAAAVERGVPAMVLGRAGGRRLIVEGIVDLPVDAVSGRWVRALPDALGEAIGPSGAPAGPGGVAVSPPGAPRVG
jgi:phosphoribosylformylglycinamidine synthase